MRVALVYDRVNKFGGAERVLAVLHEIYPDAPLYTSVYNKDTAGWADLFGVKTTFLQNIPFSKTNHEFIAPLIPIAFESFDFSSYDLVISVTSEYAKGIITKPSTLHICYCLTPTRYLWSGYDEYFQGSVIKTLTSPVVSYLRDWDKVAAQRPDYNIAISKTVQERLKKYYGRESFVIYPPVTPLARENSIRQIGGRNPKYFLLVSRLVPYKRVDIAIEAVNKLGLSLKIVGVGREMGRLKSIAGPTVEFLGNLTDGDLSRYYEECSALIFPAEEDFGLVNLEAQSFGKPVIAFKGGGARETVIEGRTGTFFSPQTPEALMRELRDFDEKKYDPKDCIKNAGQFSSARFKKEFMKFVEEKL